MSILNWIKESSKKANKPELPKRSIEEAKALQEMYQDLEAAFVRWQIANREYDLSSLDAVNVEMHLEDKQLMSVSGVLQRFLEVEEEKTD